MFEDIPKELHELRKMQMDKRKKARKDGKSAYFSKSEPDKLFIDGRYVQLFFLLVFLYFIHNGEVVKKWDWKFTKGSFFLRKGSIVFQFWSIG